MNALKRAIAVATINAASEYDSTRVEGIMEGSVLPPATVTMWSSKYSNRSYLIGNDIRTLLREGRWIDSTRFEGGLDGLFGMPPT